MVQKLDLKSWLRFGRLVLTGERESRNGKLYEKCLCDCGNIKRVQRSLLRNGNTRSCGCFQKEFAKNLMTKHGQRRNRIYKTFKGLRERCNYKTNASYKNYWGRGIKCEWETFEEFYKDMGDSYKDHVAKFWERDTTIDRINPNGNYCKENCRWATNKEQQNNRGNSLRITYMGKEYSSIKVLSEELWLNYSMISKRIQDGRDMVKAIETPKYWSYKFKS